MRIATYRTLPIETLYELLAEGVKKLLSADDANEQAAYKAHKKYIEVLITLIEEKKKLDLKTA